MREIDENAFEKCSDRAAVGSLKFARNRQAPEQLYRGELLTFPSPWSYEIRSSGIILTTDEELGILASWDRTAC